MILMDLDYFKRINDEHGHEAGDAAIREVAAVLRQATRPEDLVARWGGEEFLVALPAESPAAALERAERIRLVLAARRVRLAEGDGIWVTASLGVAYAPPSRPCDPSALIASADRGLYHAKRGGRDRVAFGADGPDRPPGRRHLLRPGKRIARHGPPGYARRGPG